LSAAGHAARAADYEIAGLAGLTGPETPLTAGLTIAFFGDSITMQGRYVRLIEQALAASGDTAGLGVRIARHGLNGGRVPDLLAGKSRKADFKASFADLLAREKPDVACVWIGVNDVWFGAEGTSPEEFEARRSSTTDADVPASTARLMGELIGRLAARTIWVARGSSPPRSAKVRSSGGTTATAMTVRITRPIARTTPG
jgi:lysophospholipase L1-like esterase